MSAGGGTALVMAGARWRVLDLARHCAEHGDEDLGFCFNGATSPTARAERKNAFERAGKAPEAYLPASVTELHGGTVTVESSGVNAGATFTVRLPLLSKSRSDRRRAPREDRLEPSHPGVTALTKLAGHDRLRDRHREPDITIM